MAVEITETEHQILNVIRAAIPAVTFNQEQLLVVKLRAVFGSDRVYFRSPGYRHPERDTAIRAEREAGRSYRWLASKYRLSVSGIRKICNKQVQNNDE